MNITTALIALHTAGIHIDSADAESWILRYGTQVFPAQRWIINTVDGVEQHRWVSAPTGQMALDVLAVLRELREGVPISVA